MMKKSYQQMMRQIHVPTELNEKVLFAAQRGTCSHAEHKKSNWLTPVLCAVCAIAFLIGGFSISYRNASEDNKVHTVPFSGLVMTACAAEFPDCNANGGLGLTFEEGEAGGSLFQIKGDGINTISLAIEGGVLGHEGTSESLSEITEDYLSNTKYKVQLEHETATLTITANEVNTFTFHLTQENLRRTESEDGQVTMVPQLVGDTTHSTPGIYAVNLNSCHWFTWPLANDHTIDLSMPYGKRVHPITGETTFHTGIDIPAAEGTEIGAAADGAVVETGFDQENGFFIVLDHGNGLTTRYYHCKQICIGEEEEVKAGDTIALVGKTGMATGSFLHFEVRQDGVAQNPIAYFNSDIRSLLDEQ